MKHETIHPTAVQFVCDALATYRITTLIRDDRVSEGLRRGVYRRFGSPAPSDAAKPSYLISCAWCLSLYAGGLAVLGRRLAPRTWAAVSAALAYSAATGLLTEAREHAPRTPTTPAVPRDEEGP